MMFRSLLALVFASFLSSCGGTYNVPVVRTHQQVQYVNNATVALVGYDLERDIYDIHCSGIFVEWNLVLTAHHCVDEAIDFEIPVRVATYKDWVYGDPTDLFGYGTDFTVMHYDDQNDLALLRQVPGTVIEGHAVINVANRMPYTGENVIVVGHPVGLGWTFTSGVVSSHYREGWGWEDPGEHRIPFIQIDAGIFFGNSGGPVLNSRNELVGIVSQAIIRTHLGMAVHLNVIRDFLGE